MEAVQLLAFLYDIFNAFQSCAGLQNDHIAKMKEIESAMERFYSQVCVPQ
jgi:hypothetical protein